MGARLHGAACASIRPRRVIPAAPLQASCSASIGLVLQTTLAAELAIQLHKNKMAESLFDPAFRLVARALQARVCGCPVSSCFPSVRCPVAACSSPFSVYVSMHSLQFSCGLQCAAPPRCAAQGCCAAHPCAGQILQRTYRSWRRVRPGAAGRDGL